MLMVVHESLLDLGVLGLDPWVLLVAMGMKLSKGSQALLRMAVVDEPTWTLGKREN